RSRARSWCRHSLGTRTARRCSCSRSSASSDSSRRCSSRAARPPDRRRSAEEPRIRARRPRDCAAGESTSEPPVHVRWWSRLFDPATYLRELRGARPRLARLEREGESFVGAGTAILVAIVLQYFLPDRISHYQRWVFPSVAALLLVALVVGHRGRINRQSPL